jgi:hypothetical protein
MLITELYNGQGLGNQLWCYFTNRLIAHKRGYDFGIMSPHKFKGKEFLNLDFGNAIIGGYGPEGGPPSVLPHGIVGYYKEKMSRYINGIDISKMDDGLMNVPDNFKIDGNMQSIYYILEHKDLINSWLNITKNLTIDFNPDNTCLIHVRGGDFLGSSAFLGDDYYVKAMNFMKDKNPSMEFKIITDDINYARKVCPNTEFIGSVLSQTIDSQQASHHIGGPIWLDWLLMYCAKNLIISASSFSFWPTWLGGSQNVIAPMYWADYKNSNGYWSCGDSLIPDWTYLNRQGELKSYDECLKEKIEYEKNNSKYWN